MFLPHSSRLPYMRFSLKPTWTNLFFFFLTWHIVKTPAGRFFFWGGAASPAFNQDVLTNRCRISLFNKASFILTLHITATAWLEERKDRGKYISQGLGGVQMAYFTWTGCVYSCPSPLHVHTLTQHRDTSRGWIFPRFSHCLFLTTISLASIIRYYCFSFMYSLKYNRVVLG